MKAHILITGASGLLGSEFRAFLPNALAPSHQEIPVEDREKVKNYLQQHRPVDILIHLAALTKIPRCEIEKDRAWAINVQGTRNVVELAHELNPDVYVVYASTPCIFPGNHEDDFYYEDSIPNPKNFYGLTKLIGEHITTQSIKNALVFRANFVAYKKYPFERAFTDRFGTYLFAHQVAKAAIEIISERRHGVLHIVGDRKLSMYELAKLCPDSDGVKPMTINDYSGMGQLTMNMSMESKRWHKYSILD